MRRLVLQWRTWDIRALAGRVLLCMAIAPLGVLLWALFQYQASRSEASARVTDHTAAPVQMTGVSYKTFQRDRLLSEVKVGEFTVRPRNVLGFRIKPLNEAVVKDVHVTLYLNKDTGEQAPLDWFPLFDSGQKSPNSVKGSNPLMVSGPGSERMKDLGLVTRSVIQGIAVTVVEGNATTFTLSAARGTADLKRKQLTLSDVVIHQPQAQRVIRSSSAVWNQVTHTFTVPGEFNVESPSGIGSGRNWTINLESDEVPVPPVVEKS